MKIKVCYLIGSLSTGGAEGQVLELIRGMDRSRFEPALIVETNQGIERVNGCVKDVRVLRQSSKPMRATIERAYHGVRTLRRLCGEMDEIRADILHAFLPGTVIYAGGGRLLNKLPTVIASRRSLVGCYRPNGRLEAFADIVATRASDFVLGNSRAIVEELVRLDGVPESRAQVIYNGVDTERFSPARRPGMRGDLGWSEEQIVFGMVANFFPYKRHCDFVRAAALTRAAVPRARFLLVGEDRGEMPAVQKAIAEAGLEPYTRIVPGTPAPELAFAAMDVYICSSETEGFSNVLLEAMATGLPVIATNVGGNPEAVSEGGNGTLVPERAPELMARAAVELAANPERLRQWAENSRRRAEELFSLKKMVQAHEELYTRLASQSRTSAWKRLAGRA
jgi:glycosyltransferase involved in cell wall biosynthesis